MLAECPTRPYAELIRSDIPGPSSFSSPPPSEPDAVAKSLLGAAVEQPLTVMPITVWNPPSENAKSPPRRAADPKRKKSKKKSR